MTTTKLPLGIAAALAAAALGVSVVAGSAHADPMDLVVTQGSCGPFDPHCNDGRNAILDPSSILGALRFLPFHVGNGITFGGSQPSGAAISVGAQLVQTDAMSGDLGVVMVDATYLPDEHGFRARFTLADTEVLFMCSDKDGNVSAPIAAFATTCKPSGAFEWVGGGARLAEIQWDTATQRIGARWGEIHAVLNLLGNANQESYMKQRLQAYAGASLDTVWYGQTPGAPTDGSSTVVRGNFGLAGMIRMFNNQIELRGLAGFRPSLYDPSDYSIEFREQALYHLMINEFQMLDIGLDYQYQYNTVPANSMGQFASDRYKSTAYAGMIMGFTFK